MKTASGKEEHFQVGEKIDSLTGMRGIACLFIVCFHYYCLFVDDQGLRYDAVPWMLQSKYIFEYSKNAVELFFMLSGFLTAWHYRNTIAEIPFRQYFKRYNKLFWASAVVNVWALLNTVIRYRIGLDSGLNEPTPLRFILSVLMINTGWFTSYSQTQLPINTTMWFIDVLLLCYMIYFIIGRLGKNPYVFIGLSALFVGIGWICLEHSPRLPFLWAIDGRGYATFFLGVLLAELQLKLSEKWRFRITAVLGSFIVLFFIFHTVVGFEKVFGDFGTSTYIRYFEFVAAPGLILAAMNLKLIRKLLSWKLLAGLGGLSAAVYYVHNNCMEDYLILNRLAGDPVDLLSFPIFLLILLSMIPAALLYRKLASIFTKKTGLEGRQ